MRRSARPSASDWQWVAAAVAFHLVLVLGAMLQFDWSLAPLYEHHDALYYTAHLADPLLQGDLSWWDNVPYRALRAGFIVLALPFRLLGVVPALLIANFIGLGAGVVAIRRISEIHGSDSTLASWVWILNPGALISTVLVLPDTIAWAAILLALLAMRQSRWVAASLITVFAVLTKEASIAAVGAAALVMAWNERSWRPLAPPAAAGLIHLSLLAFLISRFGSSFHGDFVGLPLTGWFDVLDLWDGTIATSIVAGVFVFLSGLFVLAVWWRRRSNIFLAAAAGQAGLMLLLQDVVIYTLTNTLRVGGLFWPVVLATRGPRSKDSGESSSYVAAASDA